MASTSGVADAATRSLLMSIPGVLYIAALCMSTTRAERHWIQCAHPKEHVMCKVTRRAFLATNAAFLTAAAEAELIGRGRRPSTLPPPRQVAPGVFFFEADPFTTGSNRGWVVFSDYVLVIDASFPAGAEQTLRAIRSTTDRPIRFAFDTHHHGDHAYGNQVFTKQGATAVAHLGALEEMRRVESGFYGGP